MRNHPSAGWLVLPILALAGACADGPVAVRTALPAGGIVTAYECSVDTGSGTTLCRPSRSGGASDGARLDVILGKSHVTLANTNNTTSDGDAANEDTMSMDVTLTNNIAQPIGTTDGTTVHPSGSRMFFASGPTVTAVDSGTTIEGSFVRVDNPDGRADFGSYTDRVYLQFTALLDSAEISPPELLRFVFSSNVQRFGFTVYVSTPVQYEHGWVTITPGTTAVGEGGTAALAATVHTLTGAVVTDSVAWVSSDPGVATVDAYTGAVTGVAVGTATITATSTVNAQRVGTSTVTVEAAPAVAGTTPADGATEVAPAADLTVAFSEAVTVSASSFSLGCTTGPQSFTVSGSGTSSITLNPVNSLPGGDTCTVTVVAAQVSDADADDGPDQPAADHAFSFRVALEIDF